MSANNAQKTPFIEVLTRAIGGSISSVNQLLGKAPPATVVSVDGTGTIVTVNISIESGYTIPAITCPVGFPEYIRFPIREGTRGYLVPADYYMGQMSGLGDGTARLTKQANLATSVFMPVGNKDFTPTPNANAGVLYGPDGAILTNENRNPLTVKVLVDGENNVMIYGARSVSTDVHGYGERLTWRGGSTFTLEKWHTGATVNETVLPFHPPEIPGPT
jgi:hypothetical protein